MRLGVVILAAASGLLFGSAATVRAADAPTFEPPTATSQFLTAITLREAVTLPPGAARLEALVTTEGSERTFVDPVEIPGTGAQTLTYRFDTPSGALIANTLVTLAFRVTLSDGSQVTGPSATVRYADSRFEWQTLSGSLVTVHWVQGDRAFGQHALDIAQNAIQQASQLLGVSETQPIDFYVYDDQTAMYQMLGPSTRENVGGVAFPEIRTLFADIGAADLTDAWVGIVIPHELTHLVFATATDNPYHEPLHWLNEGLAVYLSQGYDDADRQAVEEAAADRSLMPLSSLSGQFPTSADRFSLAYSESVSAVDFMVRRYGRDRLVTLIRSYARGVGDDEAFTAGIGVDTAAFEAAWLADLHAPAPGPFGPRPAPAGPVPPGWGTGAAGGGAAPGGPGSSGLLGSGGASGSSGPSAGSLAWVLVLLGLVGVGLGGAALAMRERTRPEP
ncbi:MAG TPA: peptidase MA family metallohydrolase [Candidatus Limnocylindrales bacterium]|nr:peptidase MA family metallohydrolase [Candidatus Limnocylindrales bacterium]